MSQGQHLAAIIPSKGSPFEIRKRPTPTPGPNEVLVEVKAIAINPVDYYQLYFGIFIDSYPATVGADLAGVIICTGANVPAHLQPGQRVVAISNAYFMKGAPDYGAFQERVLVPATNITPLPDKLAFKEACILPLAAITMWLSWYTLGVPRNTSFTPAEKKGLLIWGGASSVGTVVVQAARMVGFVTYVTASEKHHAYLKELGATRLFDYKDENVVGNIVKAVKEDGVTIQLAHHVIGQLEHCLAIMQKVKGEGIAKVAHIPGPLSPDSPKADGIEVTFVEPPADPTVTVELYHFIYTVWMKEKLENGELVASPRIQIIEGGLPAVQKGVDEWKKGVSCTKLVIEL